MVIITTIITTEIETEIITTTTTTAHAIEETEAEGTDMEDVIKLIQYDLYRKPIASSCRFFYSLTDINL